MTSMRADYSRLLLPGATIEVRMWMTEGETAVFTVVNLDTGEVVLKRGQFTWGR